MPVKSHVLLIESQIKATTNYLLYLQSSSKVLERLLLFTSFFALLCAFPGPMLSKTLVFVPVIVLLNPNIEYGSGEDGEYLAKEKDYG